MVYTRTAGARWVMFDITKYKFRDFWILFFLSGFVEFSC